MTHKQPTSLKALQLNWERQQATLAMHEKLWRERWDSISSPFLRVLDMNSPEFKAEREKVMTPWHEARAALASRKSKTI